MAKLKKGTVNLQIEVKNDEEWNEILNRNGLIVAEIYSNWSGPCAAMLSTLKKIKMELGGDLLNYVLACNDGITSLKRFRGRSEPVWMFIQDKKMVNLVIGSNCPNLRKVLIEEIKRVENKDAPKRQLSIDQRMSYEEVRLVNLEAVKRASDMQKKFKQETAEKLIYEEYLEQMMVELSEETALILFPWVFFDANGDARDKEKSPPYVELISRILPNRFDIMEQNRVQLDEDIIQNIFNESGISVSDHLIYGLTEDKCMVIRLKGRIPPVSWPVPYPHVCLEENKKCPTRALNDAENFLKFILDEVPKNLDNKTEPQQSYSDRHYLIIDGTEEEEENENIWSYPAVWCPVNARNKVNVFKTLFPSYMNKSHPYTAPERPLPLIVFKFNLSKLPWFAENYHEFHEAIQHFGVFEFDDPRAKRLAKNPQEYIDKVKNQSGNEIIIIILQKMNENIFLTFAGNDPTFIEENEDEVIGIIDKYFSNRVEDLDTDVSSQDDLEETSEYYYQDEEEY
ncbi:hypothetical protein PV325_013576 [Microctonus aethiopoides]|uniref:Uncharacterized protein n=1 Tax=Microctonus aethiopoides TaxID=144406 RepID=A0AA39CAX1_9HYME|nr:hypothetical protein PV325_013576 [Microctonus aethiopoides]KAK0160834.1 hypothetical protein PV328_008200 [Microctonus aethiopoides]